MSSPTVEIPLPAAPVRSTERLREKLRGLAASPRIVLVLLAAFLPAWSVGRIGAWTEYARSPRIFMKDSETFLGAAVAPARLFPWYYDGRSRDAFRSAGDPLAEWPSLPGSPDWVHVPPWEPGIALPLKVSAFLFGLRPSLGLLAGIQIGLDALVLAAVGFLAFRVGGAIGAFFGILTYALWPSASGAAAFPFYYWWPNVFSIAAVCAMAALLATRSGKGWRAVAFAVGLLVGVWCWFRGTAMTLVLAVPVIAAGAATAASPAAIRKRRGAIALAVAIGAVLPLVPSAAHNAPRTGSVTPRAQMWHDFFIGIGTRPNRYGIEHRDGYAFDFAWRKYRVRYPGPEYERAMRHEYLAILRDDPLLLLKNFVANLADSMRGWSFLDDRLSLHRWLWATGLAGIAALWRRRPDDARLLLFAYLLWLAQCATLSIVKRPQEGYLWETLAISVVAGAGGLGAAAGEIGRRLTGHLRAPAAAVDHSEA